MITNHTNHAHHVYPHTIIIYYIYLLLDRTELCSLPLCLREAD